MGATIWESDFTGGNTTDWTIESFLKNDTGHLIKQSSSSSSVEGNELSLIGYNSTNTVEEFLTRASHPSDVKYGTFHFDVKVEDTDRFRLVTRKNITKVPLR